MQKGIFKEHDALWVEKYRPQNIDEYIGNKEIKEKFAEYIKNQDIPNLLLSGTAGLGKSSIANIFVKHIDCDFYYLNASDNNNIETVRTVISNFCTTSGFAPLKIMVLDEFGYFTSAAQAALKAIIEMYTRNVRFILTCNEIEKVIEPIVSRCQHFAMIPPTKNEVQKKCKFILEKEEVEYDNEELETIIRHLYPDVRKIIGTLEQLTSNKALKLSKEFFLLLNSQKKIIDIFNEAKESNMYDKVNEIRQVLADTRIKTFNELYRYLYDNIETFQRKKDNCIPIILSLARTQYNDALVVDKEINVVAGMIELMEILTK